MGSNAGEIMIIVGVGTGPKMLTQEAGEIINQARLIYGSREPSIWSEITSSRALWLKL
jgi:precorrin-6B methylase 1